MNAQKRFVAAVLCFFLITSDLWISQKIRAAAVAAIPVAVEAADALYTAAAAVVASYAAYNHLYKKAVPPELTSADQPTSIPEKTSPATSNRAAHASVSDMVQAEIAQYDNHSTAPTTATVLNTIEERYSPEPTVGQYRDFSFDQNHFDAVVQTYHAVGGPNYNRYYFNGSRSGAFVQIGEHQETHHFSREQEREMFNNAMARAVYDASPGYRQRVNAQAYSFCDSITRAILPSIPAAWQLYYRLQLLNLSLPDEPFHFPFEKAISKLYFILFDGEGRLRKITNDLFHDEALPVVSKMFRDAYDSRASQVMSQLKYQPNDIDQRLGIGTRIKYKWKKITRSDRRQAALDSHYNRDIKDLFELCFQERFDVAQQLANRINDVNAQTIFDHFYREKYDPFGMRQPYGTDPLWQNLPANEKVKIKSTTNGIKLVEQHLMIRDNKKRQLQDQFSVSQNGMSSSIQNILYAICELSGHNLIEKIINEITAKKHDPTLLKAFFWPNGILKHLSRKEYVKNLAFDIDLLKPENSEWLRCANHDVYDILFETDYDAEQTTVEDELRYFQDGMNDTPPPNNPNNGPPDGGPGDPNDPDDDEDHNKKNNDNDPDRKQNKINNSAKNKKKTNAKKAEELYEILVSSKCLQKLKKQMDNKASTTPNRSTEIKKTIEEFYRNKTFDESLEIEEKIYNSIRNSPDDIQKISKNLKIPRWIVKKIKRHLFFEKKVLDTGIKKFDPELEIALVWKRLANGSFTKSDLYLLVHEYAELILMKTKRITAREAHNVADKFCSWTKQAKGS